jgi:NitT/TauT family transport system ATP-binding protein
LATTQSDNTRDTVIEFRSVSLSIGDKRLVCDLSFEVARGETLVLLGRSGSGKTTTLKLINRLLDPTAGEVRVEGKSTIEWDAIHLRRSIGYVIQETGLFPHFNVERNIALVPRLEGWPEDRTRERVRELLQLVGLAGYEDKYPQQLSGGMQQRTAIARAFIHDPKLILMDEPFGALDALTREQMNLEMLRIWRESGKTILFVTHSIQEAVFLASHCAVLTAGPARMAEYFPIELPFPRDLPIKTTDEFGAYARRIYASLGLSTGA